MSLITIIGRGHSGTRAMSNTLAASGVYMGEPLNKSWDLIPPEDMYEACRIFAKYVDWSPKQTGSPLTSPDGNANWSWKRAHECEIPEAFTRRLKSFLHTVLESNAEHKGWKIPETTLCFPWIARLFPDAKYIFWIRNPRDCVIGGHVTDDLNKFGIPYDPVDSERGKRAISWLYQYNLVKSTPLPKNWIEVRLEDFVFKQDETLARLEKFLGFPLVKIPVKPEVVGRWIADEEDESTDPNYFDFFKPAMSEYGYDIPESHKSAIHNLRTTNYDEEKIPPYTLPDLLTFNDGTKVASPEQWKQRRAEIFDTVASQEFGYMPKGEVKITAKLQESGIAFGGKAIREQTCLTLSRMAGDKEKSIDLNLLVYRPANATKQVPAFLGLNFCGNHIVSADKEILFPTSWVSKNEKYCCPDGKPTEEGRDKGHNVWSAEYIVDNGFALATIYYGDIDPDFHDCFHNGVHTLFQDEEWTKPNDDDWATIGAWAWGLSRTMDYLTTLPWLNQQQVCVIGHSRLGKTALWAGATDERFAITYSVQSGCGGAALSKRRIGETLQIINNAFPHWFCTNFRKYKNNEDEMPFDQHFLLSLIAPRPIFVHSANQDKWADPKGEYMTLAETDCVYKLLGKPGLNAQEMPPVDTPVGDYNGYCIKTGVHSVERKDWVNFIAFAKKHFGN